MEKKIQEELVIKSFDAKLSESERASIAGAMTNEEIKKISTQYGRLRELLLRTSPDSFGPFFAERIINRIRNLKNEIDYQVLFFFKKYQLAVVGVVIALIVLNIIASDQLTLKSVLGFEDQNNTELVENVDFFTELTN